jgi:hypothetical protein
MRPLARAAFWAVLALGYAAVALGSGLDRMSESNPGLAASTPAPFRSFAARQLALEALRTNRPDAAMSEASLSIARDPMDARSSGMLGAAHLLAGKADSARKAFTVSGALGWREPITQTYWMRAALEVGDYAIASQRLDAILRQTPDYQGRRELLAMLEASPEGRAQLINRLAEAPSWQNAYFFDSLNLPQAERRIRAEVALGISSEANVRDCPLVAALTSELARGGDIALGREVWRAHCQPEGQLGLATNGAFELAGLVRPASAFDWVWADDGAVELGLGPVTGFAGQALTVTNRAPGLRVFASQLLALDAGRYNVSWVARNQSGKPASGILLSIACDPNSLRTVPVSLADGRAARFAGQFEVPVGCTGQWLKLAIEQGAESSTLDELSIVPGS